MRRSCSKFQRPASWLLMFFFVFCAGAGSALSQTSNTGTVTGVVKDEKGAVVPGATVKLINVGTNAERTASTSAEGVYEISQLVPGTYKLEVQATGFSTSVVDAVVVNVLQRT